MVSSAKKSYGIIAFMNKAKIGIDEVGRGPLAGPVAVCAFLATTEF
jgi:ribonuclease HIII